MTARAKKITLDALDAEAVATLLDELKARQASEVEAKKAQREQGKALTGDLVTLITTSGVPSQVFQSGASGWSLGGKNIEGADGKKYRVQVLLRDEATIA